MESQKLAIPIAIVIAGALIGTSIFLTQQKTTTPSATVADEKVNVETIGKIASDDHVYGNPDAKIKIVEYSDTECPYCKYFHPTMNRIMSEYGQSGEVAWVFRHFPLSFHTKAAKEAEATECANELGGNAKFWEYLNELYNVTPGNNQLDPAVLITIAKDIKLDEKKFTTCLNSGKYSTKITQSIKDGAALGVQGTPFSFVTDSDGKVLTTINGAQDYAFVKNVIQTILSSNEFSNK